MPASNHSAASLKPLFEECGYTGVRLQARYRLGNLEIPLVGFASSERDMDSACIVAIDGGTDPKAAVRSCFELAAPVVWVRHNGSVGWWIQRPGEPEHFDTKPIDQFPALVRKHQSKLDPISIYQGRTLARINPAKQLDFVDVGLLPLRRAEAGNKLHDTVELMIDATLKAMKRRSPPPEVVRDVFTSVFRLLAGKILADKGIGSFPSVDLRKPKDVLEAVARHYDTKNTKPAPPDSGYQVLKDAASQLAQTGSFAVVSPESLAYVYEHTLVTKELRKKLGIHATPPWLVDYIVWQLYDWVREIPIGDRHVFEPACGHAPFLLSMMRLLRMEMDGKTPSGVHVYLKDHIHGVEIDDFAREIARLSLTLADIPNPNGWDINDGDMFASDVLIREAKRCRILLSNPPYERFKLRDRQKYKEAGSPVQHRKAVELLERTLQHLAPGAVFGVVVPQGVLHNTEAKAVRDRLLREFEVRELCLFADKVFDWGDAETAVILGRRRSVQTPNGVHVTIRRVREDSIARFAENYGADSEQVLLQKSLGRDDARTMRLPDLPEVWQYLSRNPAIGTIANVGQGFSFAEEGLVVKAREAGRRKTVDGVPAFLSGVRSLSIWQTPKSVWLSPTRTPVLTWRSGNYTGKPQILVNYSPVMRGPWRLKALLDKKGHAVTNTYTTVRPRGSSPPITFLWAILNSPLANAYVYCNALKRHIYDSLIQSLPLPLGWQDHISLVVSAANAYLRLVREPDKFALQAEDNVAVCEAILAMDAAVMQTYGLPARLERAVLDLFRLPSTNRNQRRRKGVGCVFSDYYPPEFKSLVPLHKFISSGYRNSTVKQVVKRFKPSESSAGTTALRAATEAFGGDD